MRTSFGYLSCVVLGLTVATGTAAETPDVVEQALQALERTDPGIWFFTETTVQNDRTFVQRHDPTRPPDQRWTLMSLDGREPTDEEREKHTNRAEKDSGDDGEVGEVRAMISPESLTLLEETPTHLVYRFDPAAEEQEEAQFYEQVDGTLRIVRDGLYVESVELRSRKPFSPGFGVKVREFETVMSFAPVGDGADVLPSSVRVRMLGRAMWVKRISESVDVSYGDYRLPPER